MQTVHANIGDYRYDIQLEDGLIGRLAEAITARFPLRRALIVTDERLWELCGEALSRSFAGAKIESSALVMKSGGYAATLDALREVSDGMAEMALTKDDAVVCVGGGTLCDTCGFAAWHHRDVVRLVQVPTSLIGMVDWAVGGKSALEHRPGTRMIGSFFPPSLVLIDPSLAGALPDRAFSAGMGEVIKTACAADAPLFRMLESLNGREDVQSRLEEIAWRCLTVKNRILQSDPPLALLGHALAHAIEATQRYRILLHGEAVAVGTLCVVRRGEAQGYTVSGSTRRVMDCLQRYDLPTNTLCDPQAMLSAIQALGSCPTAVMQRVGWSECLTVDNSFLVNAWFGGAAY